MTEKHLGTKVRIAHFHCSYVYSGGGERISLEQVLGLRKRGYQVDSFAPAIDRENCFPELINQVNPSGIIPALPTWLVGRDAADMALSSLLIPFLALRFRSYDLFIGANQPGVWFAYVLSKILGKPYIIYLNQPNRMVYPRKIDLETGWTTNRNFQVLEKLIHLFHPAVRWLDRLSVRKARVVLTNGRYIGDIIGQIYAKDYLECPAGADPFTVKKVLNKAGDPFQGDVRVNGFSITKPYILLTNRHYPQKKFEYAIQALKTVIKTSPDVLLVVSGAFTNYTERLKELVDKLKLKEKVIFLGEVEDRYLASLYQNTAVYVYTSPEEDYGMGVVEAEGFGVPVVAWNHAGPTVTVLNGETGFLAEPYKVEDFAKKIIILLKDKDLRTQMGKKARKHVNEHFTWANHLDILEEVLKHAYNNAAYPD